MRKLQPSHLIRNLWVQLPFFDKPSLLVRRESIVIDEDLDKLTITFDSTLAVAFHILNDLLLLDISEG